MARRSDPERIFEAQRAGVLNRLTGTGMQPETADRWLDAWVLEATGRGLPRDGGLLAGGVGLDRRGAGGATTGAGRQGWFSARLPQQRVRVTAPSER